MQIRRLSGLAVLLFAGLFMASCPTDGIGDPLPAIRSYHDILPVSDGWIAVGELYGRTLDAPGAVIAKYDSRGTISWEKAFGGSDMDIFYSVIEISDGYIVSLQSNSNDGDLTGLKQDTRGRMPDVTVKYDKNGTLLWAKQLNIGSSSGGIIANDSGFLAVVGIKTTSEYLAARNGPLPVTQFDTDGNVIWENPIGDSLELYGENNNTISISKIFAGPDGYFLLGQAYYFNDFYLVGSYGPCFIVSIDEDGTFRWQKEFQGPYHVINSVIMANDGFVVAGSIAYNGDDVSIIQARPIMEKFDFALNPVWNITSQKTGYFFGSSGMVEINGNIFALGSKSISNGASILGIDTNGEVFWDRELQDKEKYTTYRNIFRNGEGFIVYRYGENEGEIPSNSFLFFETP